MIAAGRVPRLAALAGAVTAFVLAGVVILAAGLPDPAQILALEASSYDPILVAPMVGATAPVFTFRDAHGEDVSLESLRSGPVILNFWATWCGPCEVEMPALQAVYEAQRDAGLRVLAINAGEPLDVYLPWAAARGLTFDLLPDPQGRLQAFYRVRGLPQTVVIDPGGIVREVFYGPVTADALEGVLSDLP